MISIGDNVVVATERGMFFGALVLDKAPDKVGLDNIQCAVRWPVSTRSFVGLASEGPPDGSRISPPAGEAAIYGVTAILAASDAASARWMESPWTA